MYAYMTKIRDFTITTPLSANSLSQLKLASQSMSMTELIRLFEITIILKNSIQYRDNQNKTTQINVLLYVQIGNITTKLAVVLSQRQTTEILLTLKRRSAVYSISILLAA